MSSLALSGVSDEAAESVVCGGGLHGVVCSLIEDGGDAGASAVVVESSSASSMSAEFKNAVPFPFRERAACV